MTSPFGLKGKKRLAWECHSRLIPFARDYLKERRVGDKSLASKGV